jgi:hypothetical protein
MARHTHCKRGVRVLAGGRTARGELRSCLPPVVTEAEGGLVEPLLVTLTLVETHSSYQGNSMNVLGVENF